MAIVTFTIPDDKIDRVKTALIGLYPIPTDEEGTPEFTENQWIKEKMMRWVKQQVSRWEEAEAKRMLSTLSTDDIIS